jgi:uncharacterized membrane protein YeaQ/YmgE (transglycosylase-associated protein family)
VVYVLGWLLAGLVIGALAGLIQPGRDPQSVLGTILLGMAGALTGGIIARAVGLYEHDESAGWVVSIGGAILLLAIWNAVAGRGRLGAAP